MNNNNDNNNGDTITHYNFDISEDSGDSDHQLKYVWDIHNNKFVSCFSLNENDVQVNAQTSSIDETVIISDQQLNIKPINDYNGQLRRRPPLTEEQRKVIRIRNAQYYIKKRQRLINDGKLNAIRKPIQRAHLTDEQRNMKRLRNVRYYIKKRQRLINDGLLSEYKRTQRERRIDDRNDEQLLEINVGKTRAKQLNDHIFNAVKQLINSDGLSDVCAEIGIVSEVKYCVDNDIDFESIISDNAISCIAPISELNQMTDLNIKQENKVYNSVYFKANGEQIEQILPIIGQKQINSDDCEGNSCDKNITKYKHNSKTDLKDLFNRIIRRKLLIERNVKFLISMCDGMGIKGIESLNARQKLLCDNIYDCFWPQCNSCFISNISLMDHLKLSHHKDNEINSNSKNNNDVYSSDCDENIYVCRKCWQKFKIVDNLYYHVVMHIDKPFMCDFCENRFDLINELLCHRDYVHFKRKFKCKECDYKTKTIRCLRNHKTRHHKNQRFICMESECNGKSFFTKRGLYHHKLSVHTNKRYECFWPECGASFKHASSLDTHLKIHNGIRITCEYPECAGKTFSGTVSLDTHMRCLHSNERPFVCDWPQCNKAFKLKNNLRIHLKRTHTPVYNKKNNANQLIY